MNNNEKHNLVELSHTLHPKMSEQNDKCINKDKEETVCLQV